MPKQEKPLKKRGGGKVHRRDEQTDWAGKRYVRLDVNDQGKDLHLYVDAKHELARLQVGDKVKISTDA